MSQPICKHCGQPIGPSALRGGVYLSAQRRRLFDAIKKSPGMSARELGEYLYPDKDAAAAAKVVIQTVHHINDLLASTDVRIKKCGYRIEGDTQATNGEQESGSSDSDRGDGGTDAGSYQPVDRQVVKQLKKSR